MNTIYAGVKPFDEVALCDVCDERPATGMHIVCGIEAGVCDRCCGRENESCDADTPALLQRQAD